MKRAMPNRHRNVLMFPFASVGRAIWQVFLLTPVFRPAVSEPKS
jgi:hypothetical protein